ncbi:MAG: carboxypeptidase-like regulatory domain-containing protein [Pirellulaceae bacterium]|nr:carboxypeptidase-like regulatory domain-containing protein [Pirellulaceae bacterium]
MSIQFRYSACPNFFKCVLLGFTLCGFNQQAKAQEALPPFNLPLFDSPVVVPETQEKRPSPFLEDKQPTDDAKLDFAAKNSGALNNLFSHQWVHTDFDGSLHGSVVALVGEDTLSVSGINVILAQKGKVIARAESNIDGEFRIGNISPGFYSIVAEADNSFATYGLAVLNNEVGAHLPRTIELRVIRPKSDDIRRILKVDMVPSVISETGEQMVRDPITSKRVFAKSHRVLSSKDGKIVGRLSRLGVSPESIDLSQMKTMLLKDGREIDRSSVTADGHFVFSNVEPGCYGLAAAGNHGVAAVAFCVIRPESLTQRKTNDGSRFISADADTAATELNVELADPVDVANVEDQVAQNDEEMPEEVAPIPQPPMPVGGSNMFGAGQVYSGSGGGGIGGLGKDLIGLGVLGGLAYLIAKEIDKDNDNDNNNAVVSPIIR